MNTDGVYGYNVADVAAVTEKMIWHCANVLGYLTDDMQKNFVDPMSENWACKEAQDFFANFKEKDEQLANRVNTRLHEFYETVSDAARIWAEKTGGYAGIGWNNDGFVPKIDISNIKEQYNGVRGINMKNVPEIMQALTTIADKTRDDMRQVREITERVPFLGGDQQEKLIVLIEAITMEISDYVTFFISTAQAVIKDTLNKYGDTAAMVSNKLSDSYK